MSRARVFFTARAFNDEHVCDVYAARTSREAYRGREERLIN